MRFFSTQTPQPRGGNPGLARMAEDSTVIPARSVPLQAECSTVDSAPLPFDRKPPMPPADFQTRALQHLRPERPLPATYAEADDALREDFADEPPPAMPGWRRRRRAG